MAEFMKMLEGEVSANFVVDDDRAHRVGFQFAADHGGGDAALLQVGEKIDVQEKPVGQYDQRFDAAVEKHLEVALKATALVVNIGENREERGLVQGVFDAAQDQGAKGVGHVKNHDTHGVAAFAA